eukprot:TRINITY_DN1391_c0_g1_i3.p1 TRINITY_DN1391_c0_g1~~TRINITY_DN1391_c0_g1_i3.p1  ORF type:complete len:299 (+),score=36.17 TRINITY_DN1391_c0_g1_i3:203-1099(+)
MAQFGIHALLAIYLAWIIPSFGPHYSRSSFIIGLYIGNVAPDLDVYPASVAAIWSMKIALHLHRTYLHSIVINFGFFLLFTFIEKAFFRKRKSYSLYGSYSLLYTNFRVFHFQAFGFGMMVGAATHMLLDILFWFSPIDLLFPLTTLGVTTTVDVWSVVEPINGAIKMILLIGESYAFLIYLIVLYRLMSIRIRSNINEQVDKSLEASRSIYEVDGTMTHKREEISEELAAANYNLKITKIIAIFQTVYALVGTILGFFLSYEQMYFYVFVELIGLCMPVFYYLSFRFRHLIINQQDA